MVQIDFEVGLGFAGKVHVEMAENTLLVGVEGMRVVVYHFVHTPSSVLMHGAEAVAVAVRAVGTVAV